MNNSHIIEVKNLSKSFNGLKAVDNISFFVKTDEIFAFLGPNGAGKSTTIKMMTTLLKPDNGEILMNGYNPVTNPNEVRKNFGIVFQDPSIDDELTAYENMEYHGILYNVPRTAMKARIEQLLKIVELWEKTFELGEHELNLPRLLQQTSDGGFMIFGIMRSMNSTMYAYFIKTDSDGNMIWEKTFEGISGIAGVGSFVGGMTSARQTSDGGYIISAGNIYTHDMATGTSSYGTGDDAYIIKTDENGNV